MAPSFSPNSSFDDSEMERTLALLAEGNEKVRLDDRYRNVNLVFGIARADKSTFVQWLAGDNSKLVSELVPDSEDEFIVKDITRNSNSQLIFPELVVDPQTDTAYYDCPPFEFTQSASTQIAGTYFVKSVVEHAQNARILLVIDYSAVRVGMDRRGFFELLQHSTNLVKNVDKLRNSIALVVTKVDNTSNPYNEQIPDERIINSIANFMKKVKEELQHSNSTGKNENLIQLIDVLLQRDGDGAYSKIALFRQPNMAGPLSEIPLLQEGKVKVLEKVNQLELSPIEKNNFRYSSLDASILSIAYQLENRLNRSAWEDADAIAQEVAQVYQPQSLNEIRAQILMSMKVEVSSLEQFVAVLRKRVTFLNLESDLIKSHILSLFNSAKYLNYLQAITERQSTIWPLAQLSEESKSSPDSIDWQRFMAGLYSKLIEYEFQQDPTRYNVANLDDWGVGQAKPQNIQINKNNFTRFLYKLVQYNIPGHDAIKNNQVEQWKLDQLNQVLDLTLKHDKMRIDCTENGDLVVTGDIIKLSDLKPRLSDECPSRISSVNIFASITLFVDADLDVQDDKLKLSVLAPKWDVIGQRRINLDGAPGGKPNPPKARSSNSAGISPEKGQPGFPGGAAGTFIGVAQHFVNREGLTISANGGVGGDGQDGGDGGDGVKGTDAQLPDSECVITGPYEVTSTRTEMHGITQYNFTDYLIHGSSGTRGGIGGDGGAGGAGGRRGVIELFNLSDSTKQQISTNQGSGGSGGRGGLGGYDGLHGDDLKAHCQFYFAFGNWKRKFLSSQTITHNHTNRAPNGADGDNRDDVRNPEATSSILQATDPMTEHKKRLRSILNGENDRFSGLSTILDRFWQVDASSSVQAVGDGRLNNLSPEWSSPLQSAPSIDCTQNGNLVVTGDLVKFSELKQNLLDECPNRINSVNIIASNTLLIDRDLDVQGDKLKFTVVAPKWEVVGQRRINLDGSAGRQHDRPKARNSNSAGISPEKGQPGFPGGSAGTFLGVAQQFVNREGLTISANGGLGGGGQEGGDGHDGVKGTNAPVPDKWCHFNAPYEVTSSRTEMHGFTQYNYTDYLIHGSSGTNGGIGGDGGAGGIGGRRGVIELFNLSDSTKQEIPTNQGSDGSGGRGGLGGYDGLHGDDLKAHCEFYFTVGFWTRKFMSSETITHDHRNQAPNGKDGANRDGIINPEATFLSVHADVDPMAEHKKQLRSTFNDPGLSAILDRLEQINVNSRMLQGSQQGPRNRDWFKPYRSLLSQISKHSHAPQLTPDQHQKMLNSLQTLAKLYNLRSSPETNTIVDVESFLAYVQEVTNVLNRLLLLHTDQHELVQQQLANIVANLNSVEMQESEHSRNNLETLIRSNFVLQQYDAVVVVLKQLVFPYAHYYVDEASFDRNSTNIEYLVNSAVASLDKMRSRVVENRRSIWRVDQNAVQSIFDSSNPVTSPFQVWTNAEHRNAIQKLLSGETVVLSADIRLSDSNKDVIKSNLVEIHLKARNSTAQAELDAELNKFMITATHMGNSNYRYGDVNYLLNSEPLDILYSFARDRNGFPINSNVVYRKIANGELMLSPYALWEITLVGRMNENAAFEPLAKYSDDVDLELVGQGVYRPSQASCNDDLQIDRWYSEYRDETIDEMKHGAKKLLKCRMAKSKLSNSIHRSSDSVGQLSYTSRIGETDNTQLAHPRFEYTKHRNANTNSLTAASNSVDVQGNLLLSQLLVGLIAGKNQTISSESSYMSPEQTHNLQVDTLAQQVLPVLSQSGETRWNQSNDNTNSTQWHRDLFPESDTSRDRN